MVVIQGNGGSSNMELASLIVAGVALLVSISAAWSARRQAREAQKANELNQEANRIADASRAEAQRANDISQEANARAEQAEARSLERNVVVMDWDWLGDGRAEVRNEGPGAACEVKGVLEIEGEAQEFSAARLEAGQSVVCQFPEVAKMVRQRDRDHAAALQHWHRSQHQSSDDGIFSGFYSARPKPQPQQGTDVVKVHASWVSPQGVPGEWRPKTAFMSLRMDS